MNKPMTQAARRAAAFKGHQTRMRRARAAYLARLKDGGEHPGVHFSLESDGTVLLAVTGGKHGRDGLQPGYKFQLDRGWIAPLIAQLAEVNSRAWFSRG